MRKPPEDKASRRALGTPRPEDELLEALLDDLDLAVSRGVAGVDTLVVRLWKHRRQLPEVLTRRIAEGRAQVPAFAFELLEGFGGRKASTYLKRIAGDRGADDIVRFGARRRLGWPESKDQAKHRLAFLATLSDPDGTLVTAAEQATALWPLFGQIIQEVLAYLDVLPTERRKRVLSLAVNQLGVEAGLLLRAMLHFDDSEIQLLSLNELVRLHDPGAAGAMARLAKTAVNPRIRAEAVAAARRMRIRPVDHLEPEAEPEPLPPVDRVLMSAIDGEGGQVIIVVRRLGGDVYVLMDVFYNDRWGIKDTIGLDKATLDGIEDFVAGMKESGVPLVEVDLPTARGALATAMEVNGSSGHAVPPDFEIWEPLLHEAYPPPEGEPATVPELDDAPYVGRNDLIRSSSQLFDTDFFDSWLLEPERTIDTLDTVPAPSGGSLTDRQYRPLIEGLIDPETCAVFRRRLRRQAWLLDRAGEAKARDLALAVAAQLANYRPAELVKQPFLRTLVQRSVDVALCS